jgi:hypothetical protein
MSVNIGFNIVYRINRFEAAFFIFSNFEPRFQAFIKGFVYLLVAFRFRLTALGLLATKLNEIINKDAVGHPFFYLKEINPDTDIYQF